MKKRLLLALVFTPLAVSKGANPDYRNAVLANSPVAYYEFDEISGTTAADTAGSFDGTYTGSIALNSVSVTPNLGSAIDLTGGYVALPVLGTFAESTVEAWIQFDTNPSACCAGILTSDTWDIGALHLNLMAGSNAIQHAVNNDPVFPASTTGLISGTWYHVVVTNSNSLDETKFYLNGIEVADSGDHTDEDVVFGIGGMRVGSWAGDALRILDGRIDELAVYGSVLSATDVADHYAAAGIPDGPSGVAKNAVYRDAVLANSPVAYYEFEETEGTTAADTSGSSFDGTYTGALALNSASGAPNLGAAVDFNGGHVALPELGTFAESTVEMWIQHDAHNPAACCTGLLTSDTWAAGALHLNMTPATNLIQHTLNGGGPDSVFTAAGISSGTWYHLVATHSNSLDETKVYLNGVEVTTDTNHTTLDVIFGIGGMRVGGWAGDAARSFDGRIDEVAVYDSVLSPTDISNHFAAASAPAVPFEITTITRDDGINEVTLTWTSQLGQVYVVDQSVDLVTWGTIPGNVDGQEGSTTLELTESATQAYFRVRRLP